MTLVAALAAIGLFAGGLAWLLGTTPAPASASRAEKMFDGLCAECHGTDGRGSWRARLFLIKPGDFTDPAQTRDATDQYLFDIIKNGGSPLGRPGMPGFAQLSDDDVWALVRYVRQFAQRPARR